jgi:hypothetical protein
LITNYFLNNLFIIIGSAKQRGAQVVSLKKVNPIQASHTMESGYILWDICRWALGKSYWKEHSNPNTENNEEISD